MFKEHHRLMRNPVLSQALKYLVCSKCFIISEILQSYCLKVKEMDDEEYSYAALQEPLYRVETGNYEYR